MIYNAKLRHIYQIIVSKGYRYIPHLKKIHKKLDG